MSVTERELQQRVRISLRINKEKTYFSDDATSQKRCEPFSCIAIFWIILRYPENSNGARLDVCLQIRLSNERRQTRLECDCKACI